MPDTTMPAALRFMLAARRCELQGLESLSFTCQLVTNVSQLVHQLQKERGYSNIYLGNQSSLDSPIIPAAIVIGAIYIGICLLLSGLAKWIEIRTKSGGRGGRTIGGHPAARAQTDTQLIAVQD